MHVSRDPWKGWKSALHDILSGSPYPFSYAWNRTPRQPQSMSKQASPTPAPIVAVASVEQMRSRLRKKSQLKGRQPDHVSMGEVQNLIGMGPHRRDLLIEQLHLLNDFYAGLHDRHLVALARQTNIPMAEIFEVATFYHHFEILRASRSGCAMACRARCAARRRCCRSCRHCSAAMCG